MSKRVDLTGYIWETGLGAIGLCLIPETGPEKKYLFYGEPTPRFHSRVMPDLKEMLEAKKSNQEKSSET